MRSRGRRGTRRREREIDRQRDKRARGRGWKNVWGHGTAHPHGAGEPATLAGDAPVLARDAHELSLEKSGRLVRRGACYQRRTRRRASLPSRRLVAFFQGCIWVHTSGWFIEHPSAEICVLLCDRVHNKALFVHQCAQIQGFCVTGCPNGFIVHPGA